jgi:hypothetical protein
MEKMEQKTEKNAEKNAIIFVCEKCKFKCSKHSNYEKHLTTRKHLNNHNLEHLEQKNSEYPFICKYCNKGYKVRNSLWYHEQKCNDNNNNNNNQTDEETIIINKKLTQDSSEVIHLTNLVIKLMNSNEEIQKQNGELHKQTLEMQKQMLEVCKNSNNTTNNNNCHNKTFNMQVFLNEKCKDAMNLTDFVNSMTLDFSDLEELGELGYVEGISRQMVRKLNEMDIYKRPIHCSDLKRETVYVRDNDVWEKETELYQKLRMAIKYITKKNGDLMIPWRNANPQCMNLQHPLNDKYLGIMNQAMGGKGEFAESESKIIKKITKCVLIDKKDY